MFKTILSFLSVALGAYLDWQKGARDRSLKKYMNWKAGYEIRKEKRRSRANIIESIDNLVMRDDKSKL